MEHVLWDISLQVHVDRVGTVIVVTISGTRSNVALFRAGRHSLQVANGYTATTENFAAALRTRLVEFQ